MPVVPERQTVAIIGHIRERGSKGVVHAVTVHESPTTWGRTLCGVWFTRDRKVRMMAMNGMLGSVTKQQVSCVECIARTS